MAVLRIVANFAAADPRRAAEFYRNLFGLEPLMDHGWIVTLGVKVVAQPQVSFAAHGGSGTQVPDLSIEVDDVEEVYRRAQTMGAEITYGIVDEPWGVRRFYLRDPLGRTLNILSHSRDP